MDKERESPTRKEEATDERTLEELNEEQTGSSNKANAPMPEPDEGSGREADDKANLPM